MIRVATCWDDGVENDARLAELFRKYHAKATFNLNPGQRHPTERKMSWKFQDFDVYGLSLAEMKDVYKGFQLASHTMHHPDARKIPAAEFIQNAIDARKYIEDTFQQESRGFAWPFGTHTPETVEGLRKAGFLYGRTCENTDRVTDYKDPLLLPSSCHYLNDKFWDIFEKAKECGVFYFWGHSYEMKHDQKLWEQTEERIAKLSADPEVQWIDVVDIVRK